MFSAIDGILKFQITNPKFQTRSVRPFTNEPMTDNAVTAGSFGHWYLDFGIYL